VEPGENHSSCRCPPKKGKRNTRWRIGDSCRGCCCAVILLLLLVVALLLVVVRVVEIAILMILTTTTTAIDPNDDGLDCVRVVDDPTGWPVIASIVLRGDRRGPSVNNSDDGGDVGDAEIDGSGCCCGCC